MRTSVISKMQRSFSIELSSLVPLQLPSRMETHLWYVIPDEVKSKSLLNQYSQLLSPPENDKVLRMRGDELKKNALLARTLVRTTIARYQTNNAVDPRTLMFKKNMYGKPEVDWQNSKNCSNPPLHFNISHTDSLIACGVTVHVPVGIDVEDKERKIKHDVLALAERFYSTDEVKFLSTIPDLEVQRKEFIKLWTLKEAYVKALGKGFSAAPFNTFTIHSKAGTKGGYNLCKEKTKKCYGEWKFALLELANSHYAAICVEDEKVNLSSSSGKFKGPGRVLGSSSSSSAPPVNPIHNRFSSSQAPNPTPRPKPNPNPNPTSSSSSSPSSNSTPLPEKPISSDQKINGSTKNPDPDPIRASKDGFDPYGAFITSSNRSQNGYSLNMFECPICKNPFTSEEEVSVHVESCLGNTNGDESSFEKDNTNDDDKSEIEKLVVVYLSGKPSESSIDVLLRLFKNIVKEPENAKFRKVRMSNAKIKEAIGDVAGGIELLELVGFQLKEENDEIWAVMEVPGEEQSKLINKVVGFLDNRKIEMPRKDDENSGSSVQVVEPVAPKKIDREIRVFFSVSENVASRIEVPDSFYSLSADEIKREADLRRKKIAESQLLIPRSYKEKQAKAARRRYKRSMIRVQFPDGVVLQGVFAPWEPTIALYEFVSSALKEPSLQFELLDPVLVKRRVIPHTPPPGQKPITLEDEELVPSALIKFRPIETDSLVYTGLCNELLEISEPLS